MQETLLYSLNQIESVAQKLLLKAGELKIWTFSGELGAGKTTLIAAICKKLGIEDAVSSPTYSIVQEYASPSGPVYHIDAYRIKDVAEATDAGLDETLNSGSYCFVEWAEKISPLLPEHYFSLHISEEGNYRKLSYSII